MENHHGEDLTDRALIREQLEIDKSSLELERRKMENKKEDIRQIKTTLLALGTLVLGFAAGNEHGKYKSDMEYAQKELEALKNTNPIQEYQDNNKNGLPENSDDLLNEAGGVRPIPNAPDESFTIPGQEVDGRL